MRKPNTNIPKCFINTVPVLPEYLETANALVALYTTMSEMMPNSSVTIQMTLSPFNILLMMFIFQVLYVVCEEIAAFEISFPFFVRLAGRRKQHDVVLLGQ